MGIGDSSFLQHISYDSSTMQLTVTMKNGAEYIHQQVYPQTADDFMQAPNKGQYYGKVIRGAHPSTRIVNKTVGKNISKKTKK